MNSQGYLESYGWKQGEALKKGGIKKPILVKHKKDKKGIGHEVNGSADAWWERLFDGQLKSLDVNSDSGNGISFKQDKVVATSVRQADSPLYRMFLRGETLQGTTGKVNLTKTSIKPDGTTAVIDTMKTSFNDSSSKNKSDKEKKSKSKSKKEKDTNDSLSTKEKSKKESKKNKETKGNESKDKDSKKKKKKDESSSKSKSKSKSKEKEGSIESDITSGSDRSGKTEKKDKKSKRDKSSSKSEAEESKSSKKDQKSKKRKSSDLEDSKPKSKKVKA